MPTAVGPYTWAVRYFAANGDLIDFSDGDRWVAQARHGFGGTDFHTMTSRGVRQAGDTVSGLYAQPRTLEVPITIFPRAHTMGLARARLARAMNPAAGDGTVEYTDKQQGLVWTMTVRPHPVHLDTGPRMANAKEEVLRWDGHDPLWYGPALTKSITVNGASSTILYTGDLATGFMLTIPCPLTPPITIRNVVTTPLGVTTYTLTFSTGTYASGNTVKVVTLFNKKASLIYPTATPTSTTDIFPNRGLGSIYWSLQPGQNVITITTGAGGENSVATLTYQVSQLGV